MGQTTNGRTTANHTVLFIHGAGEDAYDEDEPLASSLREALGSGFRVSYPRMPTSFEASFDDWAAPITSELSRLEQPVSLVGHSVGGSVLLKFLYKSRSARLASLHVVAAPFWGADDFWTWDDATLPADAAAILAHVPRTFIYHAEDDEVVPFAHLGLYADLLPGAVLRQVDSGGHQFGNDLAIVAQDIMAATA